MARVLIVDDDAMVRDSFAVVLQGAGHEIAVAADGRKGLDLHAREPFDLIVTDIVMPEMEGIEMIRRLKRDSPDVAVIAISGGARLEPSYHLNVARALGADETLAKPIKPRDLVAAVARHV